MARNTICSGCVAKDGCKVVKWAKKRGLIAADYCEKKRDDRKRGEEISAERMAESFAERDMRNEQIEEEAQAAIDKVARDEP